MTSFRTAFILKCNHSELMHYHVHLFTHSNGRCTLPVYCNKIDVTPLSLVAYHVPDRLIHNPSVSMVPLTLHLLLCGLLFQFLGSPAFGNMTESGQTKAVNYTQFMATLNETQSLLTQVLNGQVDPRWRWLGSGAWENMTSRIVSFLEATPLLDSTLASNYKS